MCTPFGTRFTDKGNNIFAFAPGVDTERLDVGYMHGHAAFAANADHFLNGSHKADGVGTFIADVGIIDAAVCGGDFGEGDDFFRGSKFCGV